MKVNHKLELAFASGKYCRCDRCGKRRRGAKWLANPEKMWSCSEDERKPKFAPYQAYRFIGYFCCPRCNRNWVSGNSWDTMGQDCQECGVNVLPYREDPVDKEKKKDRKQKKPHPWQWCEMCKTLGFLCTNREEVVFNGRRNNY